MIVVSRSVQIDAPVERVFALMIDPLERARLNPHAQVLDAQVEGGGLLGPGKACRFRLRVQGRVVDYRILVREFVPNRLIVSEAQASVPFEVRIETEMENGGTRLTQSERFEPSEAMLQQALPQDETNALVRFAYRVFMFLDSDSALRLRARQEDQLRQLLERRLDDWMLAMKRALENEQPR